jgi:hypothetical protein
LFANLEELIVLFMELIGFIVSLILFIFLMFKRVCKDAKRQERGGGKPPDALQDFLESLDMDMEKQELKTPPPPPVPKLNKIKKTQIPQQHVKPAYYAQQYSGEHLVTQYYQTLEVDKAYALKTETKRARGRQLFEKLTSKKEMVILAEILARPRSTRL